PRRRRTAVRSVGAGVPSRAVCSTAVRAIGDRSRAEAGGVVHSLGIVVPAQDEDPTIAGTIHALLAVDWGMPCEVLVVDDGSRRPVVERLIEGGVDTERVRVIT